jgi:hypothetical protein
MCLVFHHGDYLDCSFPAEEEMTTDYSVAWQDLKRRERIFGILFLTYIPAGLAIGVPLSKRVHSGWPFYVVSGMWMAAVAFSYLRYVWWRCPKCHERFFYKGLFSNPITRRCLHCGLKMWASSDPGENS